MSFRLPQKLATLDAIWKDLSLHQREVFAEYLKSALKQYGSKSEAGAQLEEIINLIRPGTAIPEKAQYRKQELFEANYAAVKQNSSYKITSFILWMSAFAPKMFRSFLSEIGRLDLYLSYDVLRLKDANQPDQKFLSYCVRKTSLNSSTKHQTSRLNARYGLSSYIEPQEAFDCLFEFIFSEVDFAWWQVSGLPGQGKSRLAFEFAERVGNTIGWNAYVIRSVNQEFYDFLADWEPESDTLLVFDNFADAQAAYFVSRIITRFAAMQPLSHFVRVLLCERRPYEITPETTQFGSLPPTSASWHRALLSDALGEQSNEVRRVAYRQKAFELNGLTQEQLLEIAGDWATQVLDTTLDNAQLEEIKQILGFGVAKSERTRDPFGVVSSSRTRLQTPLFALLAVEAIAHSKSLLGIAGDPVSALLRSALDREAFELFGYDAGVDPDHILEYHTNDSQQDLAYAANILRSIPRHKFGIILDGRSSTSPKDLQMSSRILGVDRSFSDLQNLRTLDARQPDLVAEYQIVRAFDQSLAHVNAFQASEFDLQQARRLEKLLRNCYDVDHLQTVNFLSNLCEDFPTSAAAEFLAQIVPEQRDHVLTWLSAVTSMQSTFKQVSAFSALFKLSYNAIAFGIKHSEDQTIEALEAPVVLSIRQHVFDLIDLDEQRIAIDACDILLRNASTQQFFQLLVDTYHYLIHAAMLRALQTGCFGIARKLYSQAKESETRCSKFQPADFSDLYEVYNWFFCMVGVDCADVPYWGIIAEDSFLLKNKGIYFGGMFNPPWGIKLNAASSSDMQRKFKEAYPLNDFSDYEYLLYPLPFTKFHFAVLAASKFDRPAILILNNKRSIIPDRNAECVPALMLAGGQVPYLRTSSLPGMVLFRISVEDIFKRGLCVLVTSQAHVPKLPDEKLSRHSLDILRFEGAEIEAESRAFRIQGKNRVPRFRMRLGILTKRNVGAFELFFDRSGNLLAHLSNKFGSFVSPGEWDVVWEQMRYLHYDIPSELVPDQYSHRQLFKEEGDSLENTLAIMTMLAGQSSSVRERIQTLTKELHHGGRSDESQEQFDEYFKHLAEMTGLSAEQNDQFLKVIKKVVDESKGNKGS